MLLNQIKPKLVIPKTEIKSLCAFFGIGQPRSFYRIKRGNINTNYYVKTSKGEFVFRFYTSKRCCAR